MATFGYFGSTNGSLNSTNRKSVIRVQANGSGTLTKLTADLRITSAGATNGKVKAVVYSDNANVPNALLATGDEVIITSTTSADVDLPFSGGEQISITEGTYYWIGIIVGQPSAGE